MYDSYENLKVSRRGGILTIALSNPPLNAMVERMHEELSEIFIDIGRDRDVRVVVLTGEGDAFCAGGNIDEMIANRDDHDWWVRSMRQARRILMSMLDLDQPLVARVNGHAVGLGATLALFCDIAIAAEKAKFADPHVKLGFTAGDGGAIIWPALIGHGRARRYLLTGEAITGARAAEIGLISETVPLAELDAAVDRLADTLAALPPMALRTTKRAMSIPLLREVVQSMDAHLGLETWTRLSADHGEALRAVKEKRPGVFTGA